jgi:O-antigen ligase
MENIIENKAVHYRILVAGLCIFGLTLPLSKSLSSITLALAYAYLLAVVAYDRTFREAMVRHIRQPLNVSIILFVLIAFSRSLFSKNMIEGMNFVKQVSNLLTVYLIVSVLLNTEHDENKRLDRSEKLLLFFLAGIAILDLLGILTYFGLIGNKKHVLPVTPLNMHHIWAGNLNALGLYVSASLLLFSPTRSIFRRIVASVFPVIGVISILRSTSRTAWVGILCTAVISLFFLVRNRRTYFIASALMTMGCIGLYFFNDIVHTRIDQIFKDFSLFFSGVTATSVGERLLMWKAALRMFLSNPLFGIGPGDYRSTLAGFVAAGGFPDTILKYNQPHSMYLFSLATTGLIGFLSLLFIFYRALQCSGRLLHRKERFFGLLALAVSVHFMTAGLTESLLNIHVLTCSFALIAGISIQRPCRAKNGPV